MHSLRSLAELITAYVMSNVDIRRDFEDLSGLSGFTTQPMDKAPAGVPDSRVDKNGEGR
jgi:hypothetical protein